MTYQRKHGLIIPCVECGEPKTVGRKLCRPCYARHYNSGTLNQFPVIGPRDVFESRIDKSGKCWLWSGTKNQAGYGIFLLPGEIPVRAHRYAYEFFVGRIPRGKIVMHTCDNPPCVNPKHLRIGTRADNNRDTKIKRRHRYGKDNHVTVIPDSDVLKIRERKEPQAVLATLYGVHQSTICRIRSKKRRQYI